MNGYALQALEQILGPFWTRKSLPALNDYTRLARPYRKSDDKPDKRHSILTTICSLVGAVEGQIGLDLGCGNGYFTRRLAALKPKRMVGIDNCEAQLEFARKMTRSQRISYIELDAIRKVLPSADFIVAPFIANYATTVTQLRSFFAHCFESLQSSGKLVLVVDLPNNADLRRFGAVKKIIGKKKDGAGIKIQLFDKSGKPICTLKSVYFTPATITRCLTEAGFTIIRWHPAIISRKGLREFGVKFWQGYAENPELGYVTAEK